MKDSVCTGDRDYGNPARVGIRLQFLEHVDATESGQYQVEHDHTWQFDVDAAQRSETIRNGCDVISGRLDNVPVELSGVFVVFDKQDG